MNPGITKIAATDQSATHPVRGSCAKTTASSRS